MKAPYVFDFTESVTLGELYDDYKDKQLMALCDGDAEIVIYKTEYEE